MGRYWIKVDGTDIKPALQESKKGEWNGDIDLGDGHVQALCAEYERRKKMTEDMSRPATCSDRILSSLIDDLTTDIPFLSSGLQNATELYQKKFSNPATPSETLKQLNLEMVEFNLLLGQEEKATCSRSHPCVYAVRRKKKTKTLCNTSMVYTIPHLKGPVCEGVHSVAQAGNGSVWTQGNR